MSPEAQRIAIAEACGFKAPFTVVDGGIEASGRYCRLLIPDYLHDLNAIRAADETVLFKDVSLYLKNAGNLEDVCGGNLDALYATAAQRAEALLRTLNLWSHGGNGT